MNHQIRKKDRMPALAPVFLRLYVLTLVAHQKYEMKTEMKMC